MNWSDWLSSMWTYSQSIGEQFRRSFFDLLSRRVLEVGFGPGVGLEFALAKMQNGGGVVYGADYSTAIIEKVKGFTFPLVDFSSLLQAKKRFPEEIHTGELVLNRATVELLPYPSNIFDRIFHCNSYYFWPELSLATKELYRFESERFLFSHFPSEFFARADLWSRHCRCND